MQRLFPEKLNTYLEDKLSAIYCLVGQDLFLVQETTDNILQHASKLDFDEVHHVSIDNHCNWNQLFSDIQSIGLFYKKQIFVLSLPENIQANLQKKLMELMGLLHDDLILIIKLTKTEKAYEKQSWWKEIAQLKYHTLLINCHTPNSEQLPNWLKKRAKTMGITLEQEALQLLCYNYESNLLALMESLRLLQLIYPDQPLTYHRVANVIEQAASFTPFQWIEALLAGKYKRAIRILRALQQEEMQFVVLVKIAHRELVVLLELMKSQHIGLDNKMLLLGIREQFDYLKIWQAKRVIFTEALKRLTPRKIYTSIQHLAEIEKAIKQDFAGDIWQQLEQFSFQLAS